MGDSTVKEDPGEASSGTEFSFGMPGKSDGPPSDDGEAGEALQQMQQQTNVASLTGHLALDEFNDPSSAGSPPALTDHGLNLTSPILAGSYSSKHGRAASASDLVNPDSLGHITKEVTIERSASENVEKEPGGSCGSSWSFRRSKKTPPERQDSLDQITGSKNLLKRVRPKLRSAPSGDFGPDVHMLVKQSVSLKKVPSYSRISSSDPRPITAAATEAMNGKYTEPARRRIMILSMDGGGMRGLIAARCLAHLESLIQVKTNEEVKLCEYFDFLAGTSTGAILTLMISTPDEEGNPLYSGHGCCQFYARYGRDIFRPRWYDPWRGALRQFYRPKFSPRRFEKLLKSHLIRNGRALTMRDSLRPFLVTSFDIGRGTPHIFVSQSAVKDESRDFRLWEVCRGTASAPTYFRPAEVTSVDGKVSVTLIDGGTIQNNPTLVAMTHVLGNNEDFPEAVGLQDVMILSLGAGQLDEKLNVKKAKGWGLASWVRPLINIMMDGSSETIDYQLASGFAGHNCSENYLRIQLIGLPRKTAFMDCASKDNIQDLIQCTDELLLQKAEMRNEFGEKVTLNETYAERLSWFADQLIAQKRLREQTVARSSSQHRTHVGVSSGLGPTTPIVSPMYGHLYMHQQVHGNGLIKPLETAKSVRF